MRILRFNGKFGYTKEKIYSGCILFCNFENKDNINIFKKVVNKFSKTKEENIVIVPFAHLSEDKVDKEKASTFFESFLKEFKKTQKNIIIKPFGVETEFYLSAPANNDAISFVHFDK